MVEINQNAYGRINQFLRESNNRGKKFTVQEIVENTGLSFEEVESTIKMVLKNEKLFIGGPSIVKVVCFCCRAKHLDKLQDI